MQNIGATYAALGRHGEALVFLEKSLDIVRRALPADDSITSNGCAFLFIS
jgi:hypothetical protein